MASTILCVFEGEKREPNYFSSLEKHFFESKAIIKCSYGNNLYHLLQELSEDDDLDVVELIRESEVVPKNRGLLEGFDRDDIAQVFLFFDMEPHDTQFTLGRLEAMLQTFDEETAHGKLYVSYPMVEALRDVPSFDTFIDHKINIEDISNYKRLSVERGRVIPEDHRRITKENWLELTRSSTRKGKHICRSTKQYDIFNKQSEVLQKNRYLYVLSAFPFYIYEYFGADHFAIK